MTRIFLYLLGLSLIVLGITLSVLYLNTKENIHNLHEYVNFIIRKPAIYLFLSGEIIINSIFLIRRKKRARDL